MKRIRKEPDPPKPRRRKPEISPEDHALWAHVTRSAKPLPGKKPLEIPEVPEGAASLLDTRPTTILPSLPKARILPPLAGIEKRLVKRVARGATGLDARIDLHGMRQAEAHAALNGFIHRAHHEGAKLVLVITGKGGGTDAYGEERGVLRRLVPHWLADPLMRRLVIGFDSATRGHGGDGALYVRIRRRKDHD